MEPFDPRLLGMHQSCKRSEVTLLWWWLAWKKSLRMDKAKSPRLLCRDSSLRSERLRCTSSWFVGSKDAREEEVGWLLDWESPLSPLSNVSTPRCTFLSCHWAWAPRLAAWKCNGPLPSDKRERVRENFLRLTLQHPQPLKSHLAEMRGSVETAKLLPREVCG